MTLRKKQIAAIHIGKKHLGLDDATYRHLLQDAAGVESCADASEAGLKAILSRLEKLGFNPTGRVARDFGRKPAKPPQDRQALIAKIEALLADAGRHWNYAHGCARRMFGKDALEFCTADELWRIVAALEKDKQRRRSRESDAG